MVEAITHVNWLGVISASVAHFLLAGLWFAAVFGKQYAKALGISDRPPQKPTAIFMIGPFACGAVTISTTAVLLRALSITDYGDALALGALVGVGYLAAMTLNIAINPLFPQPFAYTLVNAPMFVIGSLMTSAILVAIG